MTEVEFVHANPGRGCRVCGLDKETRLGVCFDCASEGRTEALSEAELMVVLEKSDSYLRGNGFISRYERDVLADAIKALLAENERLKAERDGSDERTKILLAAKNKWAARARQAEARVAELEKALAEKQ